ncbi:MAG: response regulator [Balneolaceae bacterium]|nr:response regulator [Balneolaceae bacterium]
MKKDNHISSKLLKRQIRKYLGSVDEIPDGIFPLLQAIDQSYGHYDSDRELLERAMDLSSEELSTTNKRLREELQLQTQVVEKLKNNLSKIQIHDADWDSNDLFKVAEFISLEIEKRKEAEKALRYSRQAYKTLVETAPDIIYRVNADGYFTYVNPIGFELSGYTEDEVYNMRYIDVVRDDYKKRVGAFYIKQVRDQRESTYLEFPMANKRNREIWIGQKVQLIYKDGKYDGILAIARDITEFRRIREDLKKAKVEAEASSKAKEAFLANMSHEIRTPMNAIIGMSRLLKQTDINNEQAKYLNAISSSSSNLIVLINDILDLSKIESGKLELEQLGFSLSDLLDSLFYAQKLLADQKGIEFHYTVDSEIPNALFGDPYRLNQILTNLINNAIKFTPKGRVELSVKLVNAKKKTNIIEFSVKDTGIGISRENLNSIFDAFSQADTSITRKFGGTGLGLAITRHLVSIMDGELDVQSTAGVGTVFKVRLPLKKADKIEVKVEEKLESDLLDLEGLSLLIVEDNRINRLLAFTLLDKWGVNYDWSENGKDAIEKLANKKFDIILMDMQMPVMDGLEATRYIRNELHLDIPIIALTANAFKDDADKCLQSGMNDVITKPFEPSILYNKILKQIYQQI